ncbi:MAG: hypothetical protein IJ794_14920 [Lachnospiraceae bacterium]|nr:hypothetical protein [Lachnospiraceae bacterium]
MAYITLTEENKTLTEEIKNLKEQLDAQRQKNVAGIVSFAKTFYADFETLYSEIIKLPQYSNLTKEDVKKYY